MEVMGAEDMTIEKGMQYPKWEGVERLLSCADSTHWFCLCKAPSGMTLAGFSGEYK